MDGAGVLDKSIQNTTDLQAMRYNQAMLTADKQEWQNAVELEHERMIENNKSEIPNKAKSSTWAMKQKANSKFCAQINACG
jgi:GTPase Era involved in 16S rRNA processing